MPDKPIQVVIGLGGNTPGQYSTVWEEISAAVADIGSRSALEILKTAPLYASPAWPKRVPPKPDYVNTAVLASTSLSPGALYAFLASIEAGYGRDRGGERDASPDWDDRVLDLDILALETGVLPDAAQWQHARQQWIITQKREPRGPLYVPHLRLEERAFALRPLVDLVPDWDHPVYQRSYRSLWDALPMQEQQSLEKFEKRS